MSNLILPNNEEMQAEAERAKVEAKGAFDLEYICRYCNLIPADDLLAFNPNVILKIEKDSHLPVYCFTLPEGNTFILTDDQMAKLETRIRARQEEIQKLRSEAIARDARENVEAQLGAQADIMAKAAAEQGLLTESRQKGRGTGKPPWRR